MSESIKEKERQLIYLLLHNKSLVCDFMESNLNKKHFSEEFQNLLSAIEFCYEKDVLLTRISYIRFVHDFKSPKERVAEERIFYNCSLAKVDVNDFPLLVDELLKDYLLRSTAYNISLFNKQVREKGISAALSNLSDNLINLSVDSNISDKKIVYENIGGLAREHFEYIQKVKSGEIKIPPKILTGIEEIDDTMGTGLAAGTLTLVCADAGAYKSCAMLNIALNVWESGHNVLLVPIEMAYTQAISRVWARQARVSTKNIFEMTCTPEQDDRIKNVTKKMEESENKFYIMQIPDSTTVSGIKRLIDKHIDVFHPKLVVIDYIDNLDVEKDRNGRHDLEISDMLQKLRTHGRDLNFAVLSGAQLGRNALNRLRKAGTSNDTTAINSEDIRGAHTFSTDADYIWAQIPNTSQPDSLLDIYVVKARNGKKIFSNGKMKASLEINPEIQLIRSSSDLNMTDDGILQKITMLEETEKERETSEDVFDDMMGADLDNFDHADF
jgi:replicative DNA helicase